MFSGAGEIAQQLVAEHLLHLLLLQGFGLQNQQVHMWLKAICNSHSEDPVTFSVF